MDDQREDHDHAGGLAATAVGVEGGDLVVLLDDGTRRRLPVDALDATLRQVRPGQRLWVRRRGGGLDGARIAGAPLSVHRE